MNMEIFPYSCACPLLFPIGGKLSSEVRNPYPDLYGEVKFLPSSSGA